MTCLPFSPPPHLQGDAGSPRLWLGWLRDRLAARGVEAFGPQAGAAGPRLVVAAEEGFVAIGVTPAGTTLIVTRHGEAEPEFADTLAACDDALAAASLESEAGAC